MPILRMIELKASFVLPKKNTNSNKGRFDKIEATIRAISKREHGRLGQVICLVRSMVVTVFMQKRSYTWSRLTATTTMS